FGVFLLPLLPEKEAFPEFLFVYLYSSWIIYIFITLTIRGVDKSNIFLKRIFINNINVFCPVDKALYYCR
ncbi:MAG: hypothetical protein ACI854_002367, partial [Arenicella sp.]